MLASRFLRHSIIYALLGISLGIYMAASRDISQIPTHAHLNLLGFVAMAIYGFFYRAWPAAENDRLAPVHFWVANLGLVGLIIAVGLIHAGFEWADPIAALFSLIVMIGMILFAVILFRVTARTA